MDSSLIPLYAYGLKILSGKEMPEQMVREKIYSKFPESSYQEQTEVIDVLKKEKFIDDDRFIENFVHWRKTTMPRGKRMIINELSQKKIDRDIASQKCEELISHTDEHNMCTTLAQHKWPTLSGVSDTQKRKEKLFRFLAGKQFSFDIITSVYNEISSAGIEA